MAHWLLFSLTKVEKDKNCQALLTRWFPCSCLFGDIESLIKNEIPTDKLLDPKKIKFHDSAQCLQHNRQCSLKLRGHTPDEITAGVIGAPCVLFSKTLL